MNGLVFQSQPSTFTPPSSPSHAFNDGVIRQFKSFLIRKEKAPGTVEKHISSLRSIQSAIKTLDVVAVEDYIYSLYQQKRSTGYLNTLIQGIRAYGDFIGNKRYRAIKYFKVFETAKGTLTKEEIDRIYNITPQQMEQYLSSKSKNKRRIHIDHIQFTKFSMFFAIMAFSGMRPGEIANLEVSSIDFDQEFFTLDNNTKTHQPRYIPIHPVIIKMLCAYIESFNLQNDDKLFPNIDRHKWKDNFRMRLEYLGIKRDHVSVYSLRHSFATRMIEQDVALPKLMKILGHKKIDTTYHYTHLTKKDIVNVIRQDSLGQLNMTKQQRILQGRKILEDLGFTVIVSKELENGHFSYEVIDG